MDFQAFVDNIDAMTCVISVEMLENGHYGDIRLVAGNKAYVNSIEAAWDGPQLMSNKFVPNSLYQNYFPQDLNFETICYRAAVEKIPVHTYVHPERFDFWFNLFLLPLKSEGNMYYCTYTQEVSQKADTSKMTNISQDTATAVLSTCIKLHGATDLSEAMQEVIKDIRALCGAWACAILLVDPETRTCRALAEDRENPDVRSSVKAVLEMYPDFYDITESWEDTIGGSNCLIVKNSSDMEYVKQKNPRWYETLAANRVTSIVLFPLRSGSSLLGYMWATNFNTESADRIKETLELTNFFIASSVANDQLLKRLKVMGSVDMLTGVLNRNEMNNRIDRISKGTDRVKNIGIVFADVNGLKCINDAKGHISGDELLKNAANVLINVFGNYDIYRAGGDEFMIIVTDTTEAELEEKAARVRAGNLGFDRASFAVGCCFVKSSEEIFSALHISDERMYQDKEEYYRKHPELKR